MKWLLYFHLAWLSLSHWFQCQTKYSTHSLQHYLLQTGSMLIKGGQERKRMKMLIVMMTVITTVISSVFWYKLIKTASFCTIRGHFSSRKDSCNHPFCFPVPSVFSLACIRINLGSFILIISYLQNWQSQKRTTETKLILKISQSIHLYNSILLE